MYKGTEVRTCLVHSKIISWMLEGNVEKHPSQQEPTGGRALRVFAH